jgi:hypothetical protein
MNRTLLNMKENAKIFKDDDYSTKIETLEDVVPFIKKTDKIYDPFYCDGYVKEQWKKLGFDIHHQKVDAFNLNLIPDYDIMISNIPFSCKEKCVKHALSLGKPFMLIMPISAIGSRWIVKYWDDLQFIVPDGRYSYYKPDYAERKSASWFDSVWVCSKMNLDEKIIKLKRNK